MIYGYVRVSTKEQNEERQMISMREFGVEKIFMDKQSGKDFNRPEYQKMVRKLKAGDVLVVHSLDRFGRNYDEIIEQWKLITKDKAADIVVLDMPLLDTRDDKNLTGRLIADIVLQLLAYVAQTEREFIRKRQREGIDAALARGVKFGREALPIPEEFHAAGQMYGSGIGNCRSWAKKFGISENTFLRWCRRFDYIPEKLPRNKKHSDRQKQERIPKPPKEKKPPKPKRVPSNCTLQCCEIVHRSLCCMECSERDMCADRCLNHPTRCGKYKREWEGNNGKGQAQEKASEK